MVFGANRDNLIPMESSDQPSVPAGERNLESMLERSKKGRLSSEEEKEAVRLVREDLVAGKTAVNQAIEAIVQLPWAIGVEALKAAWPEMKPASGRRQFMTLIGNQSSDQARRVRLSLARGLFTVDPAASLKLLVAVCREMRSAQGRLEPKDRAMFGQVLIGKAKPWIVSINLSELKPAESAEIVGPTLEILGTSAPPVQEAVLSWLAAAGQLKDLSQEALDPVLKSVGRWKPELRRQFLAKNLELPEALSSILSAEPAPRPEPKREAPKQVQKEPQKEKPNRGKPQDNGFDLGAALRQIDAHVKELRTELQQAKNALRQREPTRPARAVKQSGEEIDVEELRRHNLQLEETVQELKQQLEDLASHHEDVAESIAASEDPTEQFKELLRLKLQKDFEDFQTLAKEPPDEVFREHYRILLDNVFAILGQQGVRLP